MNDKEIRQANRKALPKFIWLMIVRAMIGGGMGYCFAKYGLNELTGVMKSAGVFFGTHIAPWIMVIIMITILILCISIYRNAKQLLDRWDDEDENTFYTIERKLSSIIWITNIAFILSYFLLAASYSGGFSTFDDRESTFMFLIGIVAFVVIMIEVIIIQQKCVDTGKQINPEKKASIYDMKFQTKWIDSCDEAEKMMIGKCAFKAYSVTNIVCTALSSMLAIGALVFNIGFLPSLVVCIIWIVHQSAYYKEAMRYSKDSNIMF